MNFLKTLKIQKRDGTLITINQSKISLKSNYPFQIVNDEESLAIGMNTTEEGSSLFLELYSDILRGNLDDTPPKSTSFSGPPYYITKIGNSTPNKNGNLFLNVDHCIHVGLFENPPYAEDTRSSLSILDVCAACIDCIDYSKLDEYINAVKNALDAKRDIIENPSGLLDNYIQLVRYYNYIVQLKSWQFNAEAAGSQIDAAVKFINKTDKPIYNIVIKIIFPDLADLTSGNEEDYRVAVDDSRAYHIDQAFSNYCGGLIAIPQVSPYLEKVYQLDTELNPGSGVRFYAALVATSYKGRGLSVNVRFTFHGLYDNITPIIHDNTFTTNNMVVIDKLDPETWDGAVDPEEE